MWGSGLRDMGRFKIMSNPSVWCGAPRVRSGMTHGRQVKDAIPLSLGPIQAAVANVRSQPWAAGVPSADSLITRCEFNLEWFFVSRHGCDSQSGRPINPVMYDCLGLPAS